MSEVAEYVEGQLAEKGSIRPIFVMRSTEGASFFLASPPFLDEECVATFARTVRTLCIARGATVGVMAFAAEVPAAEASAASDVGHCQTEGVALLGEIAGIGRVHVLLPVLSSPMGPRLVFEQRTACDAVRWVAELTDLLPTAPPSEFDRLLARTELEATGYGHLLATRNLPHLPA
jgi:hypothetical protein